MSQGSFFDSVHDELFDAPPVRRAPSAPAGPTLEEQSAAAQVVHDVWAERLACTVPTALLGVPAPMPGDAVTVRGVARRFVEVVDAPASVRARRIGWLATLDDGVRYYVTAGRPDGWVFRPRPLSAQVRPWEVASNP
jgi:hypothetical protein